MDKKGNMIYILAREEARIELRDYIQKKNLVCLYENKNDRLVIKREVDLLRNSMSPDILFIDTTLLLDDKDEKDMILEIKRIRQDTAANTKIVVLTDKKPGDLFIAKLINLGVYNILDEEDIDPSVIDEKNLDMKDVRAFYIDPDDIIEKERVVSKIKTEIKVEETIVEITKGQLLDTVITIAVAGAYHKAGTSHTCFAIASYLNALGHKVGIVQMHDDNSFKMIAKYVANTDAEQFFIHNNIDFYTYKKGRKIYDIKNKKDYNYILLDMGVYDEIENIDELHNSNRRLIITGNKEWELEGLKGFLGKIYDQKEFSSEQEKNDYIKEVVEPKLKQFYYIFNLASNEQLNNLKGHMKNINCYNLGYHADPFMVIEDDETLRLILQGLLPTDSILRKKNTLRILIAKIKAKLFTKRERKGGDSDGKTT